ncbi:MAG: hypothetical protein HY909_26880 [Deltaproteobacteria bacterium]|nr:hypothetical protein [Deltaproteobacteria bacterium]
MARWLLAMVLSACAAGRANRGAVPTGSVGLTVHNRTTDTVCYLYLSIPNEDDWGADRLGSESIAPGEALTVRLPAGEFDLKTENCQHEPTGVLHGARITRGTTLVLQ